MRFVDPSDPDGHARQPLWRGQTAPVEGVATTKVAAPRRQVHPATLTVLGVALLVVLAVTITMVVQHLTPKRLELTDLAAGDCLTSDALASSPREFDEADLNLDDLTRVDCTERHAAEVFAIVSAAVSADTFEPAGEQCAGVAPLPLEEISELDLEVRPLAVDVPIAAGDDVVCLVRDVTGRGLTGPTMMGSLDTDAED